MLALSIYQRDNKALVNRFNTFGQGPEELSVLFKNFAAQNVHPMKLL